MGLFRRLIAIGLMGPLALSILLFGLQPASAAAGLSAHAPNGTIKIGDSVSITVTVSSADPVNAFEGTISYPSSLFDGVRGTFSGGICSLPISSPDPSGGSAMFSCGAPAGFTGTGLVATVVLTAKAAGSGSIGLSGCTVLASDGKGTDVTGGCSGDTITVIEKATPTPTPATPTPTAKPSSTPKPTPTPGKNIQQAQTAETPNKNTPPPTSTPSAPAASQLPKDTPTPSLSADTSTDATPAPNEKRTISSAFKDLFTSIKELKSSSHDIAGLVALLLSMIPFLALLLAIVYFVYRLYLLERRRKRTLDRLFEMELSELAALEGKMDLLAEKGSKGREQYREEFEKAKENILRQLRPDYGRPIDAAKKTEEPPATPAS